MKWTGAVLVTLSLLGSALADDASGFRVIKEARGITVSARDEPGRDLPTLRAQGVIKGDVLHVLAVVLDAQGSTQWAKGADEIEVVREIDERALIFRTLTDTPWPVTDRESLMKRSIRVEKAGEEFHIHLTCAPKERPKVEGVIRVEDCDSYFHLRKQDAEHTFVDYQLNLDPGGKLPTFIVRWASNNVPFETLVNLEKQVEKTKGRYAREMQAWAKAK